MNVQHEYLSSYCCLVPPTLGSSHCRAGQPWAFMGQTLHLRFLNTVTSYFKHEVFSALPWINFSSNTGSRKNTNQSTHTQTHNQIFSEHLPSDSRGCWRTHSILLHAEEGSDIRASLPEQESIKQPGTPTANSALSLNLCNWQSVPYKTRNLDY